MAEMIRLAGGGVADLAWHGTERRRTPRQAPAPQEYDLAVLTPEEFEGLVNAARGEGAGDNFSAAA
jgi:hypothetical protein